MTMNNHRPPTRSPGLPTALDQLKPISGANLDVHRNPNGTYDGIGVMSDLTSLPRDEIRAIAEAVKANHARMDACAYHEFERIQEPDTPVPQARLGDRWRCKHCGGEIGAVEHNWHERGRRPKPAGSPLTLSTPDRCLACGEYHGMSGLPCPKMRVAS